MKAHLLGISVFTAAFSLATSDAGADSITLGEIVPRGVEGAASANPLCWPDERREARNRFDKITKIVNEESENISDGQLPASATLSENARRRLNLLLRSFEGIDAGLTCKFTCGTISNIPVSFRVCVADPNGECRESVPNFSLFFSWAAAINVGTEIVGNSFIDCSLLKNWKHDVDRSMSVVVNY